MVAEASRLALMGNCREPGRCHVRGCDCSSGRGYGPAMAVAVAVAVAVVVAWLHPTVPVVVPWPRQWSLQWP